jgi:hypothetical protein
MSDIPRGTIFGRRVGDPPKSEAEHFIRCPARGGWIDRRDLAGPVRRLSRAVTPNSNLLALRRGQGLDVSCFCHIIRKFCPAPAEQEECDVDVAD